MCGSPVPGRAAASCSAATRPPITARCGPALAQPTPARSPSTPAATRRSERSSTALGRRGEPLRVTLRVGNELTLDTIPPGVISAHPDGHRTQRYFHDFYNYAGLHRSVWLYSTPPSFIDG